MDINSAGQAAVQALVFFGLALISYLSAYLVGFLNKKREELKLRFSEEQFKFLESTVVYAVKSAEQLGIADKLKDFGKTKIDWALDMMREFAEQHKIPFNELVVRSMVESAILEGIQKPLDPSKV